MLPQILNHINSLQTWIINRSRIIFINLGHNLINLIFCLSLSHGFQVSINKLLFRQNSITILIKSLKCTQQFSLLLFCGKLIHYVHKSGFLEFLGCLLCVTYIYTLKDFILESTLAIWGASTSYLSAFSLIQGSLMHYWAVYLLARMNIINTWIID